MSEQKQSTMGFDWQVLYYWLMATTVGWVLGWLVLPAITVVTAGVGAGLMQCFVLVHRIPKPWRWILATSLGWLAGLAIVVPAGVGVLSGAVIGATTGVAQWLLLRTQVYWAGWWILVSVLAWSTSLGLAPASGSDALPPLILSGVLPAVLTGTTLALLLNFPKPPEEVANTEADT